MKLRAAPGSGLAAGLSLVSRSGLLRYRTAPAALRRAGAAAAIGLAALRSPDRAVIVRDHDTLTGRALDAALHATAAAIADRWPAGSRIGVRGDGGIDFVVVLAAAGLAGVDAMPIGPRHGADDIVRLSSRLDAVVDAWEVFVREGGQVRSPARSPGRLLVLSTGTSGVPEATVRGRLGLRGMLQLADADRRLRIPPGAMLVLAPPDHGHGLTMVLAGLARGRTVVLASGMRPAEQAELAARHRVFTVTGVPAQLARLLEAEPSARDGVRLVVSGSSRLPDGLRAQWEAGGARVADYYGSTETGTVAIDGRPLAGVTIEVGGDHRIRISSPLGGRAREPGDRGRIAGRRLIVEGRAGDVVDSGGELVSPSRVEAAMRSVAGVTSARVWAEPDDLLGSRLCAEVVVADPLLDAAALSRELAGRVGRAGVPRTLTVTMG